MPSILPVQLIKETLSGGKGEANTGILDGIFKEIPDADGQRRAMGTASVKLGNDPLFIKMGFGNYGRNGDFIHKRAPFFFIINSQDFFVNRRGKKPIDLPFIKV